VSVAGFILGRYNIFVFKRAAREVPATYKILFHNTLLLSRFFCLFAINPNSIKNRQHVNELLYFGTMAAELKAVFDKFVSVRKKMENKVGAAFATSADASGGKETTIMSIIQAMLIYGMVIAGDPLDATGHYGASCVGAPDENLTITALGKLVYEAERYGLPVMAVTAVGKEMGDGFPKALG